MNYGFTRGSGVIKELSSFVIVVITHHQKMKQIVTDSKQSSTAEKMNKNTSSFLRVYIPPGQRLRGRMVGLRTRMMRTRILYAGEDGKYPTFIDWKLHQIFDGFLIFKCKTHLSMDPLLDATKQFLQYFVTDIQQAVHLPFSVCFQIVDNIELFPDQWFRI